MNNTEITHKCTELRKTLLTLINMSGNGHPGGSLSCVEILAGLYYSGILRVTPETFHDIEHDRFILSKGHAAPLLYAILADRGFMPLNELGTFRKLHSRLQGHPDSKKLPGVEISTGSLGQGVSIATGMALSAKRSKLDVKVFTLAGDGELQEGVVWETFMAAAHYGLDNYTVIVDYNKIQLDGCVHEIMSLGDLEAKFIAFGFQTIFVHDGNDIDQILQAYQTPVEPGRPRCIIANTIKGKGVSFMEGEYCWHGKAPNDEELKRALIELEEVR